MLSFNVLIVGAGHGGAQAAIALRQLGFSGTIGVVGDEPEFPYERPPLSKDYLAGEKPFERLMIRPAAFWDERNINMLPGKRVSAVDPTAKTVTVQDDIAIGYGTLIWAAGGSPRMIATEGVHLKGVHVMRNRADADAVRDSLDDVREAVVVGGGYIGLEAAAVLSKLGKKVTVLEALDRVLARVAGEPLSRFYEAEHRAHGVDLRLGASLAAIMGKDGAVSGVRMDDGEVIPAQLVIVGIGIIPSVGPLLAAGASGGNGVDVDRHCRTSLPDVYAIGDCAAHENIYASGTRMRLESVQNANDQATIAAKAIMGDLQPYEALPWFWSNQYDLRLQTVGLSMDHDDAIVRGDLATRSFSVVYLKQGRVIALDCVNATKDYVQGRKLITERLSPDRAKLADAAIPLKELVA